MPAACSAAHLVRIVGEQFDAADAERAQHRRGGAEAALVGLEAELLVRVDGVEAAVLDRVGAQLVREPDAAALLREVEQHAAAGRADGVDRAAQLAAAVAAQAAEQVAGQAGGVHAHQDRLRAVECADDDGDVVGAAAALAEEHDLAVLVRLDRHARAAHRLEVHLGAAREALDVRGLDRDELAAALGGHRLHHEHGGQQRRALGREHGGVHRAGRVDARGQRRLGGAAFRASVGAQRVERHACTDGERDGAPVGVGDTQRLRTRGAQHEDELVAGEIGKAREQPLADGLDRRGEGALRAVAHDDGAAATQFGQGTLGGEQGGIAVDACKRGGVHIRCSARR